RAVAVGDEVVLVGAPRDPPGGLELPKGFSVALGLIQGDPQELSDRSRPGSQRLRLLGPGGGCTRPPLLEMRDRLLERLHGEVPLSGPGRPPQLIEDGPRGGIASRTERTPPLRTGSLATLDRAHPRFGTTGRDRPFR